MKFYKKFRKKGQNWFLDIDEDVIKNLNINPQKDRLSYTIKNKTLIITKFIS